MCFAVVLSMLSLSHADDPAYSATITAKDNSAGNGPNISECNLGTTVWLFWTQYPSTNSVIEIKVYAPDGTLIHDVADLHGSDSGIDQLKFIMNQSGVYYVQVIGAYDAVVGTDSIASETVFVSPESQLCGLIFGLL